jgi:2-polyprenyl-3-methyl-5-hydroxy-6-metoxy-1,4-benzoquinol methylase
MGSNPIPSANLEEATCCLGAAAGGAILPTRWLGKRRYWSSSVYRFRLQAIQETERRSGVRVSIDPEGTELRAIHELVEFRGKRVLEVGCGDGRMTWRYADQAASVLALDTDEMKIEEAIDSTPHHLRSSVDFLVADITDKELELPQDSFDVAILAHSL